MIMKSIGWVGMTDGQPRRPVTGSGWRQRSNPPRIYTTASRAGPNAVEVFIKVPE